LGAQTAHLTSWCTETTVYPKLIRLRQLFAILERFTVYPFLRTIS